MPPKRAAPSSKTASKRQNTGTGNGSSSATPKSTRWSAVSGTANVYAAYIEQMAKEPEPHSFICLCRPPFPNDNYSDDESDEDEDEDKDEDEENEPDNENNPAAADAAPKARCDRGKTCLCKKPATEHPDHAWVFTRAGLAKSVDQQICSDLRCPDLFDMYTFNDHAGYGIVEVVENLVMDFDEAKDNWNEQWALCEAAVLFLLSGAADPMMGVDDGAQVSHLLSLIARMFLATLAKLEALDMLKPDSEIKNLGVIMAAYIKFIDDETSNGISEEARPAKKFRFDQSHLSILAYAKKHGIELRSPSDIDDLVKDLEDELEKVNLPAAGDDPWNWTDGLKKYIKDHAGSYKGNKRTIGGDGLDITTWSAADRKKNSFNGKDCFSKKEIDALKNGMILQMQ